MKIKRASTTPIYPKTNLSSTDHATYYHKKWFGFIEDDKHGFQKQKTADNHVEIPLWIKWSHRSVGDNHCMVCLSLDSCWFNILNKPFWPIHPKCHCLLEPVDTLTVATRAKAICQYAKLDPYLFDPAGVYGHGKNTLFESWGYSITDSEWLKAEFEKQAREKYIAGEYSLSKLDMWGQRINIRITIPRRDKIGTVSFETGWLVRPNGQITLNTPYGGN